MSELTDFLDKQSDDRGVMAALRCALTPSQEARAWPYLAAFGGIGSDHKAEVVRTVAGLYAACHKPDIRQGGSVGSVCRELCSGDENPGTLVSSLRDPAPQPGPMARKFAYLLNADRSEICGRVIRTAVFARSKGLEPDYETLERDLLFWPRAREAWAKDFWGRKTEAGEEAEKK